MSVFRISSPSKRLNVHFRLFTKSFPATSPTT